MTLDTKDTQDAQRPGDTGQTQARLNRPQTEAGMRAMQGTDAQSQPADQQTDQQPDLATVHPHVNPQSIETPPNVEAEGRAVQLGKSKPPKPPEGWRPGDPEGGS